MGLPPGLRIAVLADFAPDEQTVLSPRASSAGSSLGTAMGRSGGPYIVIVAGALFTLTPIRGRAGA